MEPWVAFYDDGSVFRSDECGPGDLPRDGLLVIVYPTGKRQVLNADFFVFRRGRWYSHDQVGLSDTLYNFPTEIEHFRAGRYIHPAHYAAFELKAMEYVF